MNRSNLMTILATLLIAVIFIVSVFLNMRIKYLKEEISDLDDEIKNLSVEIKRDQIEISTLTNPKYVLEYIDKKKLKPVPLDKIEILTIKE